MGIAVYGDFLYVTNPYINTVSRIDIFNPAGESTLKQFLSNDVYRLYENPRFVLIHEDFAYVSNFGSSIISKISLECPEGEDTKLLWADEK